MPRLQAFDLLDEPDWGRSSAKIASVVARLHTLAGVETYPVDLNALAQVQGVHRVTETYLLEDGRLRRENGGFVVELAQQATYTRKRFSLAHEIAHTLLWTESDSVKRRDESHAKAKKLEERLCDRIAVELLMPERAFSALARELEPSYHSVAKIAFAFGVSLSTAFLRLAELRVWESPLFFGVLNTSGRYSLRRIWVPRSISDPQRTSPTLPPDSAPAQAIQRGVPVMGRCRFELGGHEDDFLLESAPLRLRVPGAMSVVRFADRTRLGRSFTLTR